jgi:hypothetical protein
MESARGVLSEDMNSLSDCPAVNSTRNWSTCGPIREADNTVSITTVIGDNSVLLDGIITFILGVKSGVHIGVAVRVIIERAEDGAYGRPYVTKGRRGWLPSQ